MLKLFVLSAEFILYVLKFPRLCCANVILPSVPYLIGKVALRLNAECEIGIVDGTVHITMISAMRTEHEALNFEDEVEVERIAGKVKVRSSFEDGKIVQLMRPQDPQKKPAKSTRQINENGNLVLIWEIGYVIGTRTFSRKQ